VPEETTAEPAAPAKKSIGRRILGGLVSVGLIVAIFAFLIPKLTTVSISSVVGSLTVASVVVTQLLGLVHLLTNWTVTVASLPGLTIPQAGVVGLSGAAVSNTLPEGGAVGTGLTYAEFHSWGFRVDAITASILTTGAVGQFVRYGLLGLSLLVLDLTTDGGWPMLGLAVANVALVALAIVIFVRILQSEQFADAFGRFCGHVVNPPLRLVRKGPVDVVKAITGFRSTIATLVLERWRRLTVTSLLSELSSILILGVALRMMGVPNSECSWALVFVAYGGMQFASMVAPTPGGVGVAEASLLAILGHGVPASQDAPIVAGIVLYRMATWLQSTLLGIPAYFVWRYRRSWRVPVPGAEVSSTGR
jgi:putative heme transporter